MAIQWTKRPQNFCRTCGNSWYPRGKDRSANCPRCGSEAVDLPLEGCLRAIGYLIAAPFILVGLILQGVATLLVFVVGGVLSVAWWLARSIFKIGVGSAQAGSAAAQWSAEKAVPAGGWLLERSRPLLTKLGTWLWQLGRQGFAALMFVARWVASAKEEVLSEGDHEVNPVSLVAKLLTFVIIGIGCGIVVVKVIRGIGSLWG